MERDPTKQISLRSHMNQRGKAGGMEIIEEEDMSLDGNDLSQLTS